MKILKINITEFAALRDLSIDLEGGMNIIEGANESGKSSIMAFIKFMLYGFPRKATGDEIGERERGISWSGRRAAGSMTVEVGSGVWRIERDGVIQARGSRESYVENLKIINTETGETLPTGTVPGEHFLKIPASVFSSTCSIEQLKSGNIDSEGVGSNIENLLFSADENVNAQKAVDRLNEARKQLLYKNERGGKIFDLRTEYTTLRNRLSEAITSTKNMLAREALAETYQKTAESKRAELDELENLHDASEILLTVKKFDSIKELREQRDRLSAELENLEKKSFAGSFIPERSLTVKMSNLAHRLSAEESALIRADAELERLENTTPYDEKLAAVADMLNERGMGSDESLLSGYGMLKKRVKSAKSTAKALFILGSVAIVGSAALILFLPIAGIPAAVLGIGGIIGGILAASSSKKRQAEVMKYLAELGIEKDEGEDGIRRYADACFEAQDARAEYLTVIEARRGVCSVCRQKLDITLADCNDAIKSSTPYGEEPTAPLTDSERITHALSEASDRIVRFCNLREKMQRALENKDEKIAELTAYLERHDEALTRKKCEALEGTEPISGEEYKSRRTELMREIKTADDKKNNIEKELTALDATSDKPRRLMLLIEENQKELEECSFKLDAIKLASDALSDASGQLRRRVTPKLCKRAGGLMSDITGGKYTDLVVSQDMEITVTADNATHPIASMSVGTRDAAYIALRLSLIGLLCPDEKPPVMLDEALAHIDDTRAENLLSMLTRHTEDGTQCLLFTCQSREGESLGNKANIIKL